MFSGLRNVTAKSSLGQHNLLRFSRTMNPECLVCALRYVSSSLDRSKDMIGPPDKISNLRPVKLHVPPQESDVEKDFRLERQRVQDWNEKFWKTHNLSFIKEIEEFRQKKLKGSPDQKSLSTEEMSEFYKLFLDKNWKMHVVYNFKWYCKNFNLIFLALKVKVNSSMKGLLKQ